MADRERRRVMAPIPRPECMPLRAAHCSGMPADHSNHAGSSASTSSRTLASTRPDSCAGAARQRHDFIRAHARAGASTHARDQRADASAFAHEFHCTRRHDAGRIADFTRNGDSTPGSHAPGLDSAARPPGQGDYRRVGFHGRPRRNRERHRRLQWWPIMSGQKCGSRLLTLARATTIRTPIA